MKLSTEDSQTAVAAVHRAYRETRSADRDWLAPLQEQALAAFTRGGFPTPRHEDWKYTNLARLAKSGGELLGRAAAPADAGRIAALLERLPRRAGDYTLVFANGRFEPGLSELPDVDAGIRFATLTGAGDEDRARFTDWIDASSRGDDQSFEALNAAFMIDGAILDIAAEAQLEIPLHVVFATDGQAAGTQPRLRINAAAGSSARVLEHHVSSGPGWTNAITDIRCERAARLTYVKLQDEDDAADHVASQTVQLEADSHFRAAHIDLGARLARNDLRVRMTGPGGQAELFGLFLVDGQRHVDNHTRTDHIAGNTVSDERYRGIINERGRGVFNGKIIVHEGADGTDAQLSNRNLLLAKTAEIDTKPELEIYTDDVKCAHGATTGQLDEQALFYLRARGVPRQVARHMLVLAFAREIFEQFDPAATELNDYINETLERRLPE